jgi:HlyD family secretion protein
MNATATIVVDSVSDVLMIPVTAVSRGSLVLVKGGVPAEGVDQSEAPDGAAYVRVETGLNNESFIEVKSGLSEGDVVLAAATQAAELQQNAMMMGPGFGGGGGMVVRTEGPGGGGAGPGGERRVVQGGSGGAPGGGG